MLTLPPADAADLVIRNEARIGPDSVLVESSANATVEGDQIAEVHEHHGLAERLTVHDENLESDQHAGRDAQSERQPVIGRRGTRPNQERAATSFPEAQQF